MLSAYVAGAMAAALRVEGFAEVRQQYCAPALHLLLAVCDLHSPAVSGAQWNMACLLGCLSMTHAVYAPNNAPEQKQLPEE